MSFWLRLSEHLAEGEPAFVAVVADHTRHSPGTRGAKMFVRSDGSQEGTIGGGAMEADLIARGVAMLGDGVTDASDTTTLHHRADADGERSGLICAGKQTMHYFVAEPDDLAAYRRFAAARRASDPVELVIERGAPRLEERPVGERAPVGLDDDTYFEHAVVHHRIAIAGGGHCGFALSRTMRQLGYHVTIFETREDVFTLRQNDHAHLKIVVDDYAEIGPHIRYPELTHVVVMTADFPSDVRALIGVAGIPAPFKGVMGSSAKLKRIEAELEAAGVLDLFPRLFAPIGLEMTSNTPEEIAISIAAQILRLRNELFEWARPSPL